jgi:hypothetical protein
VVISKGELEILEADRFPLGRSFYNSGNKSFSTTTKMLNPNDQIFLFSDGYKDQFGGENGKTYSSPKFYELLQKTASMLMEDQKVFIEDALYQWKGNMEQIDDILVIGIQI